MLVPNVAVRTTPNALLRSNPLIDVFDPEPILSIQKIDSGLK
jgi:hypothetical protein